jgi:hypothetical protein
VNAADSTQLFNTIKLVIDELLAAGIPGLRGHLRFYSHLHQHK